MRDEAKRSSLVGSTGELALQLIYALPRLLHKSRIIKDSNPTMNYLSPYSTIVLH